MKYILLVFLFSVFYQSCSINDIEIHNLNNDKVMIFGHAGAGFREFSYSNNSFESYDKAIEGYGVDGVEMDIQMSRDSSLFLYHDSRLETVTTCEGCMTHLKTEELVKCKYVQNFHIKTFRNQYLTSLKRVFQTYANDKYNTYFLLDLKSYPDCYEYFGSEQGYSIALVDQILKLIHEFNVGEKVFIEVNSVELGKRFKTKDASSKILWNSQDPTNDIKTAMEVGAFGIIARNGDISLEQVERAHNLQLWVAIFSVKTDQDNKDAIRKNPDILITDNIPAAIKFLTK